MTTRTRVRLRFGWSPHACALALVEARSVCRALVSMREGELLRLDWANVFMNAKRLTVAATDTRVLAPAGSGHYATRGVGTPKTRSGKRDVPIPSEAEHLRRRRYIAMGCPKKGLVFPSQANLMCRFPLAFY